MRSNQMGLFSISCKRFFIAFNVALFILCFSSPSQAQVFNFKDGRKRETLSFNFVKNLIIIPITINGKGPYNFVVDTGVSLFLITDPFLLNELNITNKREIKIIGMGEGEDLSAYVTPSVFVRIGDNILGNTPAAILRDEVFNLSGFTGMKIHGLIGYEFFNSFIVRIRYNLKSLTVYKNETAYVPRKGTKVPISIEERKAYLMADILMDDNKTLSAKLIIDTGAGHPISLETDTGMPFEVPEANIVANLGIGLSGPIGGFIARLRSVKIGKYELKNVISAFPDYRHVAAKIYSVARNGNIGNSILKRFDVVFDYQQGRMFLRPTFTFREPFEHDMSGIEFVTAGINNDRIFINRVEPGSPADLVKLKSSDEIVAINFKSIKDLGIQGIEDLFRSEDGKNFLLDVIPAETRVRERVLITLRRRI